MSSFVLDSSVSIEGSHKVGDFTVSPADFVRVFGCPPSQGDGCKISGEYIFSGGEGSVFTLYDWKETSLYLEDEENTPEPDSFWRLADPRHFYIGGKGDPGEFIKWLRDAMVGKVDVMDRGGVVRKE